MTPNLLEYLCEPITNASLQLIDAEFDSDGMIISGLLVSPSGKTYPIINGIPRFVEYVPKKTVESFGDEWNYFNFTDFKQNWLSHTVANTFGSTDVFKDKVIVDAGGGSGAQTKWFAEYGARHVIMMDLSHSVDDVVQRNLHNLKNVDVIQHTPSVEKTAHALYEIVGDGGEFVFNCYPLNDKGLFRWMRFHLVYKPLRAVLSHMSFRVVLFYARFMSVLRLIPGLGFFLEKSGFCVQGDVPLVSDESFWQRLRRRFEATSLNTFDNFGSHQYQHLKTDLEIKELVAELQPDSSKVLNMSKYFLRPAPIGCALRIFR